MGEAGFFLNMLGKVTLMVRRLGEVNVAPVFQYAFDAIAFFAVIFAVVLLFPFACLGFVLRKTGMLKTENEA